MLHIQKKFTHQNSFFQALGANINVKCCTIVGGVDMIDQAIALAKKPHIIVATPGRIVDHLENTKGFNLRNLQYLVSRCHFVHTPTCGAFMHVYETYIPGFLFNRSWTRLIVC